MILPHFLHILLNLSMNRKTLLKLLSGWQMAMEEEFQALISNETWELVPPPSNVNVIGCKWVSKIPQKSVVER